jgi:hypothetical protein
MPRGKFGKQQRSIRRLKDRGQKSALFPNKADKKHVIQVVECIITKHNGDFNKLPTWLQVGEKSLIIQYIKEKCEEEKKK